MKSQSDGNMLISLEGVSMVREGKSILRDVSLDVRRGDFMAITGPNGGGKTTLLRIILGLLKPTRGSVAIDKNLTIGYLPQKNMIDSHFPITVDEVVEQGLLRVRSLDREQKRNKAKRALELVGMESRASQPIGQLSGGQLQRTLFARAIVSDPQLLVLDEPLSYLDKKFEHKIYDILADLSKSTTILLVSHEMSTIADMANRHLIVDGSIHECTAAHHFVRTECDS